MPMRSFPSTYWLSPCNACQPGGANPWSAAGPLAGLLAAQIPVLRQKSGMWACCGDQGSAQGSAPGLPHLLQNSCSAKTMRQQPLGTEHRIGRNRDTDCESTTDSV